VLDQRHLDVAVLTAEVVDVVQRLEIAGRVRVHRLHQFIRHATHLHQQPAPLSSGPSRLTTATQHPSIIFPVKLFLGRWKQHHASNQSQRLHSDNSVHLIIQTQSSATLYYFEDTDKSHRLDKFTARGQQMHCLSHQ